MYAFTGTKRRIEHDLACQRLDQFLLGTTCGPGDARARTPSDCKRVVRIRDVPGLITSISRPLTLPMQAGGSSQSQSCIPKAHELLLVLVPKGEAEAADGVLERQPVDAIQLWVGTEHLAQAVARDPAG
jgi:hypothetical protein